MPSRKVVSIGGGNVRNSAEVTGGIGYQPRTGVKWKGKSEITSSGLQKIKDKKKDANKGGYYCKHPSQGSTFGNVNVLEK